MRGELRVVTHDPASTSLSDAGEVYIGEVRYEIALARAVRGAFLLRLTGLSDRNQAETLRGLPVSVDRSLIPLEEGEVFLADMVGCQAVLPDGTPWGEIVAIESGPQDRLVVHQGEIERLLPLVPPFIESVDLEAGRVVVTPPEGLPESRRR